MCVFVCMFYYFILLFFVLFLVLFCSYYFCFAFFCPSILYTFCVQYKYYVNYHHQNHHYYNHHDNYHHHLEPRKNIVSLQFFYTFTFPFSSSPNTIFINSYFLFLIACPLKKQLIDNQICVVVFSFLYRPSTPIFDLLEHKYQDKWIKDKQNQLNAKRSAEIKVGLMLCH